LASSQLTMQSDFAVVALLDALGAKGLLSRSTPDGLLETWQMLLSQLAQWCDDVSTSEAADDCSFLGFSDTVLITIMPVSEADQPECFSLMHDLLQRFIWQGFVAGVYFRGAVSAGRFIQSSSRVLGEGLEEAAEWYEQADWMGVMATPGAKHLIEHMLLDGWDMSSLFVPYGVPLRTGRSYDTWAVNWPSFADEEAKSGNTSAKAILLRSFRTFSGAISPAVALKYANTITFADKVWDSGTLHES